MTAITITVGDTPILEQVTKVLKNNTKLVEYKPYSTAAKYLEPKLLLPIKPIEIICKGISYRVVPMYKNLAISAYGMVLEYDKMYIKQLSKSDHGYLVLSGYDLVNNKSVTPRVHRLVAMVWCDNNDYKVNNLVDHRDGNVLNNHRDNLRWISNADNIAAGYHNGAVGKFKIYTMDNKSYYTQHSSLRAVCRHLNIKKDRVEEKKLPKIVTTDLGEFLVSLTSDTRDVDILYNLAKGSEAIFNVTNNKTGAVSYHNTLKEIITYYNLKINTVLTVNIRKALKAIDMDLVSKITSSKKNTYKIKNLTTGEILTKLPFKKVIAIIKCSPSTLGTRISKKEKYGLPLNGWLIASSNDKDWPEAITHNQESFKYIMIKSGVTTEFSSRSKLAKYLNVAPGQLKRRLLKSNSYNGYTINVIPTDIS